MALSYELEDKNVQVSYVDSNIGGKKQLTIVENGISGGVHSFSDGQITSTDTVFGQAVTVTLKVSIDSGNRLFTLFIPKLAGAFRARPLSTVALLTTNRGVVSAPELTSRNYEALDLTGTVSTIDT
jgi:hypothetical protein